MYTPLLLKLKQSDNDTLKVGDSDFLEGMVNSMNNFTLESDNVNDLFA